MKKKIYDFLIMNAGIILLSFGVYFFKIPNGFSTGGVSGIGTILGTAVTIFSPATWILIINLFLLIVGFVFLGKETGIKTIYCSIAYSLITMLLEKVAPVSSPLTNQPFLELVYAMLLTSIGSAIIFYKNASSGGTDIVALILKKFSNMDVCKSLLCTDFIIAAYSFFVFGIQSGLYSLLGLFFKAFLVDGVIDNFRSCKYFVVITDKPQEIVEYITSTLHHGVTTNKATGEFTHSDKTIIHTVCKRIEAIYLQIKIKQIDPHAFIIITTTSEIIGRGFRSV